MGPFTGSLLVTAVGAEPLHRQSGRREVGELAGGAQEPEGNVSPRPGAPRHRGSKTHEYPLGTLCPAHSPPAGTPHCPSGGSSNSEG